jgi:hypothetical protein
MVPLRAPTIAGEQKMILIICVLTTTLLVSSSQVFAGWAQARTAGEYLARSDLIFFFGLDTKKYF